MTGSDIISVVPLRLLPGMKLPSPAWTRDTKLASFSTYEERSMSENIPLERIDSNRWRIPQHYLPEMRVPGMLYADDELLEQIKADNALQQVVNVATLPGIVGHSLA